MEALNKVDRAGLPAKILNIQSGIIAYRVSSLLRGSYFIIIIQEDL